MPRFHIFTRALPHTRRARAVLTAACAASLFIAGALADFTTPQPAPSASDADVMIYASQNLACHAWTDSCRLCLRMDDQSVHCSTPGIACTPAKVVCTRTK